MDNTSAIVPVRPGPRVGRSRVATSPKTATLRKRTAQTFGVDVSDFGNLTPAMVRNMSISAKVAKEQREMLDVYIKAAQERNTTEAEIEAMRASFLKDADKTLRTLDKTFQGAVLTNARHEQHMLSTAAYTTGALGEIRLDGSQKVDQTNASFAAKYKASRQLHSEQMRSIGVEAQSGLNAQLREMRDRPLQIKQATEQRANWMNFIMGKPKAKLPASKSNFGGWFA